MFLVKNVLQIIAVAILLIMVTVSCKKEVTKDVTVTPEEKGVVINGVKWATRNVDKPGTFAANNEVSAYNLFFSSRNVTANTNYYRAYGFTVRCVKE